MNSRSTWYYWDHITELKITPLLSRRRHRKTNHGKTNSKGSWETSSINLKQEESTKKFKLDYFGCCAWRCSTTWPLLLWTYFYFYWWHFVTRLIAITKRVAESSTLTRCLAGQPKIVPTFFKPLFSQVTTRLDSL